MMKSASVAALLVVIVGCSKPASQAAPEKTSAPPSVESASAAVKGEAVTAKLGEAAPTSR